MAYIDIRRMLRNYLPVYYRETAIESLLYALFSPLQALADTLERMRTNFRLANVDLFIYSIKDVRLRIWDLYSVAYHNTEPLTTRVLINELEIENARSRQIHITFGVDHVVNTNFHLSRIKPLLPAGVNITISYDT